MKAYYLITLLAGIAACIGCKPSGGRPPESDGKNEAFVLISRHPDPDISSSMLSLWRRGEIAVAVDIENGSVQGQMAFYSPQEALAAFGIALPAGQNEYPVLRLNRLSVMRSYQDPDAVASMQKTIRHEYEHYVQWKTGSAFHDDYPEGSAESCAEIWKREKPVYEADCRRWEKWWRHSNMGPAMTERCRHIDSTPEFNAVLSKQMSSLAPTCAPTFEKLAFSQ